MTNKFDTKIITITERLGFKLALFSASMMTILGPTLIAPALPAIHREFSETPHIELLVGLSVTIPALFMMCFTPLAGILMDRFGRLKFLYPAMIFWVVAGCAGAWCNDIYSLLVSRCVLGIASSFITTASSALLGDYYAVGDGRREKALSLQGFVMALGGAGLTIIAGYLASFSWQYVFYVYASGICIFIFCIFYLFEPRTLRKDTQILRQDSKMEYKNFIRIYFAGFFVMMIYYLAGVQFPHYIENILGLEEKYIGLAMAIPGIFYAFSAYFYKNLRIFFSMDFIYVYAFAFEAFGFLLMALIDDFIVTCCALAIFGIVGGIITTNNSNYLFSIVKPQARARAYGGLASCLFFGQFISPIITTPIVLAIGFQAQFYLWAGVIVVVVLIYLKNARNSITRATNESY